MIKYLNKNLLKGYTVSPLRNIKISSVLTLLFILVALPVGIGGGLFFFQIMEGKRALFALFALFLFPALPGGIFFSRSSDPECG